MAIPGGPQPYMSTPPLDPGMAPSNPLVGSLAYTPTAAPTDPGHVELERLLASLEVNRPQAPPRPGTGRSILGALGDALLAAGRAKLGGMPPDLGPFAAQQQAQQQAYEDAMMQADENARELRNRVRVGAFEQKQRTAATLTEKQSAKTEERDAYNSAMQIITAQVPETLKSAGDFAGQLIASNNSADRLAAQNIDGAVRALVQTQAAVHQQEGRGIFSKDAVTQYKAALDNLRNLVSDKQTALESSARAEEANANLVARAEDASARAEEKSKVKNVGALQRTQAVFPEIASMAKPLLERLDKVGATDYSSQINGELNILGRRIKDGLDNPTETAAMEASKQADDLRRIMVQAHAALSRQDAERFKQRQRMQTAKAQIAGLTEFLDSVQVAKKFYREHPDTGGPVMGRITPNVLSATQDALAMNYSKITTVLLKNVSGGAVTDAEYERSSPQLPSENDPAGRQLRKLEFQERFAQGKIAAKATEFGLSQADVDAIIKAQRTGKVADLSEDDLSPVKTVPMVPPPPGFDPVGGAFVPLRSP